MRKFLIGLWLVLALIFGIADGWAGAMFIILPACFIAGVWTVIGWIVNAAVRPQERFYGPPVRFPDNHPDPRDGDPTRPNDEHPVIALKDYQWRRVK